MPSVPAVPAVQVVPIVNKTSDVMDLRLSEEENLIQRTAARFVDQELLTREGAFLKQKALFLPPGAPKRRELDADTRKALVQSAKQVGLWALEFSEDSETPATSAVARVLIYREFGRTILPF